MTIMLQNKERININTKYFQSCHVMFYGSHNAADHAMFSGSHNAPDHVMFSRSHNAADHAMLSESHNDHITFSRSHNDHITFSRSHNVPDHPNRKISRYFFLKKLITRD